MDALSLGFFLAILSGFMNGTFTLPMKYLGRWNWENVWALFILVSCLILPAVMVFSFSGEAFEALKAVPTSALLYPLGFGGAWGFGAIMFGQGVSAIGISLGNSLVLGLSSSLGSLVPLWVLEPEKVLTERGLMIILGTAVTLVGVAFCGLAGRMREKERGLNGQPDDRMVGKRRSVFIGLLLCAGAGILSAVFNIGYSLAAPLVKAIQARGVGAAHASDLVWLLMLSSGSIANLVFCAYLFRRNRSFQKYRQPRSQKEFTLTVLMGLLWGGSIFVYGAAAAQLGKLGPAIGWPASLAVGLLTANAWGFYTKEWQGVSRKARATMIGGTLLLLVAVTLLGWSSRMEA